MLKIRLKKLGRKKKPFYRIIVIDSRKKRDGKAIQEIGFYNPINKQHRVNIEQLEEQIAYGAKLTKTVEDIINKNYKNK